MLAHQLRMVLAFVALGVAQSHLRESREGRGALEASEKGSAPRSFVVKKLRELPHEKKPWTQGLEFTDDGQLLESSGDYPPGSGSFLRVLDWGTGGEVKRSTSGLDGRFIEGVTKIGNDWIASTYQNGVALVYNDALQTVQTLPFKFNGWGLTHTVDGRQLIATNGTSGIMFLDAKTLAVQQVKVATCLDKEVAGLNELEMVPSFLSYGPTLLGNVINTRVVLAVDPSSGRCVGAFHLRGLEPLDPMEAQGFHVANGIAFNKKTGTYMVTGKNWASMFEVQILDQDDKGPQNALEELQRSLF